MRRPVESEDEFYTIEEFERLPEAEDGSSAELVRGHVVREPPPGEEHGWLQVRLGRLLDEFVEAAGVGLVVGDTGYILTDAPATVRGPDLSFISQDRLDGSDYPIRKYRRTAPDLAVEIVSPWNRSRDITSKVRDYLRAGTRVVWVVDPAVRTVTVHGQESLARVYRSGDELDGGEVLPGFRVQVSRVFIR